MVVDFLTYNPNYGLYIYYQITFTVDWSGLVIPQIKASAFRQNYYQGANAARAVFEIVYILFVLYYAFFEFLSWLEEFRTLTESDNETFKKAPLPENPNFGHRILNFFNIDLRKFKKSNYVSRRT